MLLPLEISSSKRTYKNYTLSGKVSTLNFTIETYCSRYYYGNNCSVYCNTNNGTERFTCNKTTGEKVCFKDYYNINCTTHCKTPTESSHYYCDKVNGSKMCNKGWSGANCTLNLSSSSRAISATHWSTSIHLHQSVSISQGYHNATSIAKAKARRWITSTGGGIATLCFLVILCMGGAILFVVLFRRNR